MIEITNVSKSFGGDSVLTGFNLSVKKGERVCLMGRSGCGKSTVLNLLLGFIPADSGTVLCDSPVSAVFQEDRLCEDFSALSNVKMVLPKGEEEKAIRLLEELSLGEDLHRPVRDFSGGMKRRVAIARALAAEYEVLLLDEAFTGLDELSRKTTADCINRHSVGKTILMVSHDKEDAELLGAQIISV